MPHYIFQCPDGHEQEIACHVDKRDDPVHCEQCNQPCKRRMTSAFISYNRKVIMDGDDGHGRPGQKSMV